MRARQITGNVFKLAILCACVYAVMKWQGHQAQDNNVKAFAENACVDEVGDRYNLSNLRPYDVKETHSGYTVRASAASGRGTPIKVVCVTNTHGSVTDITIDEL